MANVNKVILIGNLTRDVQLKQLQSGMAVAETGLATNRKWKAQNGEEREDVCFIDLTAFGKQAEVLGQYGEKGKQMYFEGRLKLDQWEDKNGGGKRSKLSVVVESFQFLGGRDSNGEQQQQRSRPDTRKMEQRVRERPEPESPFSGEQEFKDDDIPF